MSDASRPGPGPLVQVEELAAAIDGEPAPTVLDVRWRLAGPPGIADYRAGHLPGAVYCDLDRDLAAPAGVGGRHPLPEPDRFQTAMRRLGVRSDLPVVVYDGGDAMGAARAWWCLRYFGHPDVRVLDGGYPAWQAAGLAGPTEPVIAEPGDFVATPGGLPVLDADLAAAVARTALLLDVRTGERYRAEVEPIDPVAGHIPGAVNAPIAGNLTPAGSFRPAAELRAHYAALGARPDVPTGAYCGSGVAAAQTVLALTVAGLPATLYPGSWSNWIADSERLVAIGPEPG